MRPVRTEEINEKARLEGWGELELLGDKKIKAGRSGSFTFVYTVGKKGMKEGDAIEIMLPLPYATTRWTLPQFTDPNGDGYTTYTAPEGIKFELYLKRSPRKLKTEGKDYWLDILVCKLVKGSLKEGDVVKIHYGDRTYHSIGVKVGILARKVYFPVKIVREGEEGLSYNNGTFENTKRQATFMQEVEITGGDPKVFFLVVPSYHQKGKKLKLKLSVQDIYGNRACEYRGNIWIYLWHSSGGMEDLGRIDLEDTYWEGELQLEKETGVYRILGVDPVNQLMGLSNPFKIKEKVEAQIWWGETHLHTNLTDGSGDLEEMFEYAKTVSCLDFLAPAEHGERLMDDLDKWRYSEECVKKHDSPGQFVAIPAIERAVNNFPSLKKPGKVGYGHINFYFEDDHNELFPREGMTVEKLYEYIQKSKALAIPHHTGYESMGFNFEVYDRDDLLPVVEIYSCHGNSEYYNNPRKLVDQKKGQFFRDAMKGGLKFGVIAGGDLHEAMAGGRTKLQDFDHNFSDDHFQYRGGLAAVIAPVLERRALLKALRERKCYGTSGDRILVEFEINGVPMGSTIREKDDSPRRIKIFVAGTHFLRKIELVKNGEVYRVFEPNSLEFEVEIEDKKIEREEDNYYLSILQADGEMAWSSPIWVKNA